MNGTLKLRWLQAFLEINIVWFSFSYNIFYSFWGIDFLLRCDFEPSKLKCKLSSFHSQVLLYWNEYTNTTFRYTIVLCGIISVYLLRGNLCFFRTGWTKASGPCTRYGWDGNVLVYDDFCVKYNIICTQILSVSVESWFGSVD